MEIFLDPVPLQCGRMSHMEVPQSAQTLWLPDQSQESLAGLADDEQSTSVGVATTFREPGAGVRRRMEGGGRT